MVVEDEIELAELLGEILEMGGDEVVITHSGSEALAFLESDVRFDALISDLRMPGLDGPALYEALVNDFPDLACRTAFLTGDTLSAAATNFLKRVNRPYRAKPFEPREIAALVAEAIA